MSDLSFKSFALAKGFTLPLSTLAVAKSLNMSPPPPVSMRAMIATSAPFIPANPSFATANDVQFFGWWDQASPPLFNQSPPDPLRAATSFEFMLWALPSPNSKILVDDATLPSSSVLLTNGTMYYAPGVLDGSYTYQITAINQFGTASTSVLSAQFSAPAAAPNISVTSVGMNMFKVSGMGFGNWNGQTILLNADPGLTAVPVEGIVTVTGYGGLVGVG